MICSLARSCLFRLLALFVVGMPILMAVAWLSNRLEDRTPSILTIRFVSEEPSPTQEPQVQSGSVDASGILGAPSVSADFINRVLVTYHSPASGSGQAIYDDGVQFGIDPVFALAFFMHESSFGRAGIAVDSRNPGNIRCLPNVVCRDNFAWFSSWADGFSAWYALIRNLYVNQWHAVTVAQIIPHYAPTSDHNDESAYISAVLHAVEVWRSGSVLIS